MFEIVDKSLQSFDYRSMFFYGPISSPTRLSDITQFDFSLWELLKNIILRRESKICYIMKMIRNTWISKIRLNFNITSMQRDTISNIIL